VVCVVIERQGENEMIVEYKCPDCGQVVSGDKYPVPHECKKAIELRAPAGPTVMAFDTETSRISYENPIPPMMCCTYADAGSQKGSITTPWEHDISSHFSVAWSMMQHCVGHNTSFDLSILAFQYPELLPHIFSALENDLLHDTLLREKLLNLTMHGNLEMIEINGSNIRPGYKLCDLEKKYLDLDRTDLKNDEDAPRMNYGIYKNVPLDRWEEGFISYAIDDAVNTGLIYQAQEVERQKCIDMTGYDPFAVETFIVRRSFALRLLECVGECLDPEKVIEVTEKFRTEYAQPRLRGPLLAAGLLIDALPPRPYVKGTLDHSEACNAMKDDKEHKKRRRKKECGCPPKMKAAEPEHKPKKPLHQYIWNLAGTTDLIEAWPADACISNMKKAEVFKDMVKGKAFRKEIIQRTDIVAASQRLVDGIAEAAAYNNKKLQKKLNEELAFCVKCGEMGHKYFIPDDITLTTADLWNSTFSALDPLLAIWAERGALSKIITDYLPKMYIKNEDGTETPAAIIRPSFYPLCLTGRTSSSASKLYPSRNGQNVDPRVRPCTVPRPGNVIVSTDIDGMELGTLAQRCVWLFGNSQMADNINNGIDNHAYLAAQIAAAMDDDFNLLLQQHGALGNRAKTYEMFSMAKGLKEPITFVAFQQAFTLKYEQEKSEKLDRPVMWSDFYKHYRLLAKPTGLGFPGGMSPPTVCTVAKGTYKLDMSVEVATLIRQVWLDTYPEMGPYLEWIKKQCLDPHHAPVMVEEDDGSSRKKTFFA
jgi:hypothetical protein